MVILPEDNYFGEENSFNQNSTSPFDDSLFHQLENQFNYTEKQDFSENKKLQILKDCIAQIPTSSYTRFWNDYKNNSYENTFEINNGIVCEASYNRNTIYDSGFSEEKYWNNIYSQLIRFDTTKMSFIYDYFDKIREEKELDYRQFAEMVVSFVQSIPYTLILDMTKEEAIQKGGTVAEYLKNQRGPYIENIKYGLLSPLEFLYSIRGDCDTRTVTIYAILSHFGYDVVILNCLTHSMIGLNLSAQGRAFKQKGKKYYFWETTAKGWELGQLPPEYETVSWYIALPSVNNW